MATEKPIVSVVIDESTLEKIDKYAYQNKINSRSKTIGRLIAVGLAEEEPQTPIYKIEMNFVDFNDFMKAVTTIVENNKTFSPTEIKYGQVD
jgi:metal-responsive CopG/Arc/MetJ family transcriptional regulator